MPYYEDLSRYSYHGSVADRLGTRNVGWLGLGHKFRTMIPTEDLLDRLWCFCKVSVAQMRGIHQCEFCGTDDSYFASRKGEKLLLGTSEIRVFSKHGAIYAAPTLIYHYISFHWYCPPDEFIHALVEGPAPPDREYFERLEELGLEWNQTSAPSAKPSFLEYPKHD